MLEHTPRRRKAKKRYHHMSFGWGVRLAHESWYVDEAFQGLISRNAFRKLCKALRVPMLHVGIERWVDMHRFELAMTAVLRIGEKDFVVWKKQGGYKPREREEITFELNEERFKDLWEVVVRELLVAKQSNGTKITREVKTAARKAAERMTVAGLQFLPSHIQGEEAKHLLKAMKLENPDAALT